MSYAFIIPDSYCVVSPQNDTEHSRAERENYSIEVQEVYADLVI